MPNAVNDNEGKAHLGSCPICSKPGEERWRPFCSKRCADVDLHRWLSGSYAIPAAPADEDEMSDLASSSFPDDIESVDK